jgi:hypothetical protein
MDILVAEPSEAFPHHHKVCHISLMISQLVRRLRFAGTSERTTRALDPITSPFGSVADGSGTPYACFNDLVSSRISPHGLDQRE